MAELNMSALVKQMVNARRMQPADAQKVLQGILKGISLEKENKK